MEGDRGVGEAGVMLVPGACWGWARLGRVPS